MSIETTILNSLTNSLDDKVYCIDRQFADEYIDGLGNALLARVDFRRTRIGYVYTYAVILMDDEGNIRFGKRFEDGFEEVVEHKG